jgi:hypothetical protein
MLRFELGVLPLERLQLRDLSRGPLWRRFRGTPAQSTSFGLLPPLGQHEGMNLQRGRDGLDLNARLLTQPNRGELKLVAVPIDLPWTGSWHDTSSSLGESVHETGARAFDSCNNR